jgi:hypothetical protein
MLDVPTKTCAKCKIVKSVLEFHAHKNGRRNPRCKLCRAEDHREYYKTHPDKFKAYKARARGETVEEREARIQRRKDEAPAKRKLAQWRVHIRNTLGVTEEQYQSLYLLQGGKCAICASENPGGKRERFCIDHCHDTGVIRGLLCVSCNSGLGYFKDDISRLGQAAEYLKGHKC